MAKKTVGTGSVPDGLFGCVVLGAIIAAAALIFETCPR